MEGTNDRGRVAEAPRDDGGLVDPVDRISEILFGLIMAVTIVGSLSIATAGREDVRTVLIGALGCNLAWGLVDAVMYVVRTATQRSRLLALGRRVVASDPAQGRALIAGTLPDHLARLMGAAELEAIRQRVLALADRKESLLTWRDLAAAGAIFLLVVVATFPVVVPFIVMSDAARAMRWSQGITVVMLFLAGTALGKYGLRSRPAVTGVTMATFGVVLIGIVMALGG
jgi:hypothetical protein